jgi:hypothetical protein
LQVRAAEYSLPSLAAAALDVDASQRKAWQFFRLFLPTGSVCYVYNLVDQHTVPPLFLPQSMNDPALQHLTSHFLEFQVMNK